MRPPSRIIVALLAAVAGCKSPMSHSSAPPPAAACDPSPPSSPITCLGKPLENDQSLQVTLSSVTTSVDIRVGGQSLAPTAIAPRNVGLSTPFGVVGLSPMATPPYSAKILPGTYRLWMGLDARNPPPCDESILPCGSGPVSAPLTITQSGVVVVDIASHQVSGTLTFDGHPAADCSGLRFTRDDGWTTVADVTAGSFRRRLLAGVYRVELVTPPQGCADWPLTPAILQDGLVVDGDVALPIDVPLARVSGQVKINGTPILGDSAVQITIRHGASASGASIAVDHQGRYSALAVAGPSRISYSNSAVPCDALPCGELVLQSCVNLTSGTLDFDVPALSVAGRVILDGQPLDRPDDHGSLMIDSFGFLLGNDYHVLLVPGRHSLSYSPTEDARYQITTAGGWLGDLDVTGPTLHDLDLSSVALTGQLTVNGSPPPPAGGACLADLDLTRGDRTSTTCATGGATAPASYSIQLFPGTYSAALFPDLPCQADRLCTAAVLPDVTAPAASPASFDVRAVRLGLSVSIDGAAPDACAKIHLSGDQVIEWADLPAAGGNGLFTPGRYTAVLEQDCAGTLAVGSYPLWDCQ